MKYLLALAICIVLMSFGIWQPNMETALQTAKAKHQLILLNFSGSDWCGPCMRLRKEIFDNDAFQKMADTSLLMVNADFPRNKKNQLDKATQTQNNALADKYNPNGHFPFTLLIDANGKVIKSWDGLPKENAEAFTKAVKLFVDANR